MGEKKTFSEDEEVEKLQELFPGSGIYEIDRFDRALSLFCGEGVGEVDSEEQVLEEVGDEMDRLEMEIEEEKEQNGARYEII